MRPAVDADRHNVARRIEIGSGERACGELADFALEGSERRRQQPAPDRAILLVVAGADRRRLVAADPATADWVGQHPRISARATSPATRQTGVKGTKDSDSVHLGGRRLL